uniref:Uncharacterized protein n=1 Tax=Physcomitrium patens TaxID=3218 RepID=A0A2K1J4K8_PHYPA|nr:hypothetical protein PHYPA_022312 [Physcomitrium patens]
MPQFLSRNSKGDYGTRGRWWSRERNQASSGLCFSTLLFASMSCLLLKIRVQYRILAPVSHCIRVTCTRQPPSLILTTEMDVRV